MIQLLTTFFGVQDSVGGAPSNRLQHAMLQWHVPDTTYWDVRSIDAEWKLKGESEPQIGQIEKLAFSLKLAAPKHVCGLAPTRRP